jgi:hypothetical protein
MKKALYFSLAMFACTGALARPITCSPTTLHPGDKLTIKYSKEFHDVGVLLPRKVDGRRFVSLILDGSGTSDSIQLEELGRQKKLVIDVDNGRAIEATHRIFMARGTYEFVVSEQLETDDGTPQYSCKVRFTGPSATKK